jgi:glycosyltransferase involved in cell wall biosynthesis
MKPLVSVLIPCFNVERFIGAALKSILLQTYTKIEVIVVDDGSNDGSADVVKSFVDRNVTFIQESHRGAAATRNLAFSRSNGTFALFMDADDVIGKNHIEALVKCLDGSDQHIGTSAVGFFRDQLGEAKWYHPSYCDLDGISWLVTDWRGAKLYSQCGMFLIPRELLDRANGWNEKLSSYDDVEFFGRIFSACAGTRFAADAALYYRCDVPGGLTTRTSRTHIESRLLAISLASERLLEKENSNRTRLACADLFQAFDYEHFPRHPDLRAKARRQVVRLGGSHLIPHGSPKFQLVRRMVGWRAARFVQIARIKLRNMS